MLQKKNLLVLPILALIALAVAIAVYVAMSPDEAEPLDRVTAAPTAPPHRHAHCHPDTGAHRHPTAHTNTRTGRPTAVGSSLPPNVMATMNSTSSPLVAGRLTA